MRSATPRVCEIAAKEKDADGLLVIMTPQGMTDPVKIAEGLKNYASLPGKPILASWMGGYEAAPGEAILNAAGIPTFPFPDAAVRAFLLMAKYNYNLNGLYETPALVEDRTAPNAQPEIAAELQRIREQGRTILTEFEAKEVFKTYGIPVVETKIADQCRGSCRPRPGAGLSGGAEAAFGDHHAQDRRGRRATESGRCDGGRAGLPGDSGIGYRQGRSPTF